MMLDASHGAIPLNLTLADLSSPATALKALPIPSNPAGATHASPPAFTHLGTATVAAATVPGLHIPAVRGVQAAPVKPPVIRPMQLQANANSTATSLATTSPSGGSSPSSGGGSGSSPSGGSSPSSGGGSGNATTPYTFSVTFSDDTGDSVSETANYQPTTDGYTYDLLYTYNFGSGGGDDGATGSFGLHINAGAGSATIQFDATDSDHYSANYTLAGGPNSGTLVDSGNDSSESHETLTINADGSSSDTYSDTSSSSDQYHLSDSGTIGDGSSFNWDDSGTDSFTSSDSGSSSSDGTSSATYSENDKLTEKQKFGMSGAGLNVNATSNDTFTYQDQGGSSTGSSSDTATTTDVGDDSSTVQATDPTNGFYTATHTKSDTYNDSNTAVSGVGIAATDNETDSGSNSEKTTVSISGVPDQSGTDNETSTSNHQGAYQYSIAVAPDANGNPVTTDEDVTTYTSSIDDSGSDPGGAFSESSGLSQSSDIVLTNGVLTKDTSTSSPSGVPPTGAPPNSSAFVTATMSADSAAYGGVGQADAVIDAALAALTLEPSDQTGGQPGDPPASATDATGSPMADAEPVGGGGGTQPPQPGKPFNSNTDRQEQFKGVDKAQQKAVQNRPSVKEEGDWEGVKRPKQSSINSTEKSNQRSKRPKGSTSTSTIGTLVLIEAEATQAAIYNYNLQTAGANLNGNLQQAQNIKDPALATDAISNYTAIYYCDAAEASIWYAVNSLTTLVGLGPVAGE